MSSARFYRARGLPLPVVQGRRNSWRSWIEALQEIPEAAELLHCAENGGCPAAMTGLGPVHRAHVCAALLAQEKRPLLVVCSDEGEAPHGGGDLQNFTGIVPLLLPSREFQFHAAATASREWEQRRVEALYCMAQEQPRIVVAAPEALVQRTLPKEVLMNHVLRLHLSDTVDLNALGERLVHLGYTRCQQVEGMGQLRCAAAFLDVFGPGMDAPVRVEFFGDEVDAMGAFDLASQRRVHNMEQICLLPAGEVLPAMTPGGSTALAEKLEAMAGKLSNKKRSGSDELIGRLKADAELCGRTRCVAVWTAIWRPFTKKEPYPLEYLASDAMVCICDSARVMEHLKNVLWQVKEDVEALLKAGVLCGEWAGLTATAEELLEHAGGQAGLYACVPAHVPLSVPPRTLLQLNAKQLSSYGGSLETAVSDMEQYLEAGYRVLVLCGSEARAKNLKRLLEEKKVPAALDFQCSSLPGARQAQISLGALSAGIEYPQLSLAVLTEGQLRPRAGGSRRPKRPNRIGRSCSPTDLSPGDLVVHAHHGVGRLWAFQR